MNEDTLVVVHCYQGDQHQVQMLLPNFTHHGCPVLLLSPEDSPVSMVHPQVEYASAGLRGWKGPQTVHRQVAHWKLALARPQSWFFLNDSDSLCLTPDLPGYLYSDSSKLWCNVLCHEDVHLETDQPNLNPPYFMHRRVLEQFVAKADEVSDNIPQDAFLEPHDWGQAIDGFYTMMANELQIPYGDFPDGITTWPRGIMGMVDGARYGARILHGVKTRTHLRLVQAAYDGWRTGDPSLVPVSIISPETE
jgi:hypothetical protein